MDEPKVYFVGGAFLICDKKHALTLRQKRIMGQLIGCPAKNPHQVVTSDLPCVLNNYAISTILEYKLATFYRLIMRDSVKDIESRYLMKLNFKKEEARRIFIETRTNELNKRGIKVTTDRIGHFDVNNMRIDVPNDPDPEFSIYSRIIMTESELNSSINVPQCHLIVYKDLYKRGFYITMGTKFGVDFLAYQGDPVRYHAQYAVYVSPNSDGKIDLNKLNYSEINATHRLCHTANKTLLLATICDTVEPCPNVEYLKLKPRQYMAPDSNDTIFLPVSPIISSQSQSEFVIPLELESSSSEIKVKKK